MTQRRGGAEGFIAKARSKGAQGREDGEKEGGFETLPFSFKIQLPQSVLVDIQLESNICDRAALVGGANRDGVCAKRSGTIDEDHGRRGIDTDAGRVSVP